MNVQSLVSIIDLLATATLIGATVWFFFVQSPVMLARAGRERFVPMQMKLTRVLFRVLEGLAIVAVAGAAFHSGLDSASVTLPAIVGLVAVVINNRLVIPRALRAGGAAMKDIRGRDEEGSVGGFASEGAGEATTWMHRLVVVFVVAMLGGMGTHLVALMG
jgi:hypothetical protein